MKRHCFTSYPFFALIGLILSPLSVVHAQPSPDDSVLFCAPFDYEQWRRDNPRSAGKALTDLNRGEPRTVRIIYFLPTDLPYRAAGVDSIKSKMRQAHTFFGNQMSAHGYEHQNFRFETDAAGQPLVHRVDGQHPTSHYTASAILEEIDSVFDISENVYLIVIDTASIGGPGGPAGVGRRVGKNGGFALVGRLFLTQIQIASDHELGTTIHELGHAFGLYHDFREDADVMSYGYEPSLDWIFQDVKVLSFCNAQFLATHPYFNHQSPLEGEPLHTVEELTSSPIHTEDATSISVRVRLSDPDGLHQAMLLTETKPPHYSQGFLEVKSCQGLDGQTDAIVEFDHDGVLPSMKESDFSSFRTQSLQIQAVDVSGNVDYSRLFDLINNKSREPIAVFRTSGHDILRSMDFSVEDDLIVFLSSDDFSVSDPDRLWNMSTGRSVASLRSSRGFRCIGPASFSADNIKIAMEVSDGSIEIWDRSHMRHLMSLKAKHERPEIPIFPGVPVPLTPPSRISALVFSPDGKFLASGGRVDRAVHLWNTVTGLHVAAVTPLSRWGLRGGSVQALAFSPDGHLLAAWASGRVTVWDITSKNDVATVWFHDIGTLRQGWGVSNGLSFSADGTLLASAWTWLADDTVENSEIKLWDVATGDQVVSIPGNAPLAFSPDGKFLASGSASQIRYFNQARITEVNRVGGESVTLWDVNTWEPVNSFSPFDRDMRELKFSSDMRLLAERSSDTIRLWDISEWTGAELDTAIVDTAIAEEGDEDLASMFDTFGGGKLVALPDRTQLLQNAPNPFNSQTVLSYFLLAPGPVRLEVFALTGQRVAVLHQGPQQAGYHRLHWDGRDAAGHPVASGAYLYRLVTDEEVLTRKLILLR